MLLVWKYFSLVKKGHVVRTAQYTHALDFTLSSLN